MYWGTDWPFKRLAKLAWPADLALAITWCKGSADAKRRMAHRHEGYRAMRLLKGLGDEARSIAREVQNLGDPS